MTRLKRRAVLFAVAVVVIVLSASIFVYVRIQRALRTSEARGRDQAEFAFTVRQYVPFTDAGFEWISAASTFSHAAFFQGHLFLANSGGLLETDGRGARVREFYSGKELPPATIVRLTSATMPGGHSRELILATDTAGILTFDGTNFRQMLPASPEARTITTILPTPSGQLLIGTANRGLLSFDGKKLVVFHPTLKDIHVTELFGTETDLWIGTSDRGVAHWHGGTTEWFNETNGLPDSHVYSIAGAGNRTYVGTPNGAAEFVEGRFSRVLAQGAFIRALLPGRDTVVAGTMDDGVLELPLNGNMRQSRHSADSSMIGDVQQFMVEQDKIFAVTPKGVYERTKSDSWTQVITPDAGVLHDGNISALAVDEKNRLWVGYFDRGLDVVSSDLQHARHYEDDHLFCVNRILPGSGHRLTAVATANGLVLFDASGERRQVLRKADGLIADHVTDVVEYRGGLAVATPAGLSFVDGGGIRSLYAFHGLTNNHVYALAANGSKLLAGTLGGITMLNDEQVLGSYTTASSGLKHNWITAALPDAGGWWIGTYGQGVMHVDASGQFQSPDIPMTDTIVNSNAMLSTPDLLLAGTLGQGLILMNRRTGRWLVISNGLPSLNVTALAAADGFIYVGTDHGLVRISERRLAQ